MIPTIILRDHVIRAAEWISQHGVGDRDSKKYLVVVNGRTYPPKLVISRAYFYAHGSEWSHENFTGGEETNSFLRGLGFKIVERQSPQPIQVEEREGEPICENCGHGNPSDFVFCEKCGHKASAKRSPSVPDRREFSSASNSRTVKGGPKTATPGKIGVIDQVRTIAERLSVRVEIPQLDSGQKIDSALDWITQDHSILVGYITSHIDISSRAIHFSSEESLALSVWKRKDLDRLFDEMMVGKTEYVLMGEGVILTHVLLQQEVLVDADGSVPAQRLVDSIEEVSATWTRLDQILMTVSQSLSDHIEDKSKPDSPDNMYV